MSKWTVTHTGTDGATVTVVSGDEVGQNRDFLVFFNEARAITASFPVSRVVSVVKIKKGKPEKAPEVPAVSRDHPVYTYGKGDLAEALRRAINWELEGKRNALYLGDIIRDLKKGS